MDNIEQHVQNIIQNLVSNTDFDPIKLKSQIIEFVRLIKDSNLTHHQKVDWSNILSDDHLTKFVKICLDLNRILNIQFDVLTCQTKSDSDSKTQGTTQQYQTVCLGMYLTEISKHHIHIITKNDGSKDDGSKYECTMHPESLITHLLTAMVMTYIHLPPTDNYKSSLNLCLTALVHDIGKYSCVSCIKVGSNNWTQYPMHGEMGCGILMEAWTSNSAEFSKLFTYNEWSTICRTISCHMCGYHETDQTLTTTQFKWGLLRSETDDVKQYLYHLSFGDHFGRFGQSDVSENNLFELDMFLSSREHFNRYIRRPFLTSPYTSNGVIIFLYGPSASGKSSCVKTLSDFFESNSIPFVTIERDNLMTQVVADDLGESYDGTKAVGSRYQIYRQHYESKKLGPKVNELMKSQIAYGIATNQVVIIDSLMTLYRPIEFVLPPTAKSAFKIGIHCVRNELLTEADGDRLGISLVKQLGLIKDRTIFSWLPESVSGKNYVPGTLKMITPITTAMDMSTIRDLSRPTTSFVTAWSSKCSIGMDEIIRQLGIFLSDKIKQSAETSAETPNTESEMGIVQYVNHLYKKFGFDHMQEIIESQCFNCSVPFQVKNTPYAGQYLKIKYFDHCRFWKAKWARESRGVILRLDTETDQFICDKMLLQRGAEVLTGYHSTCQIDTTQDILVSPDKIDMFDEIQQDTIIRLHKSEAIDGVCSSKKDGSLLGVCVYGIDTPQGKFYAKLISEIGTPLAKLMLSLTQQLNLPFVAILSTQNTLMISDMNDYMVDAMLLGQNIITQSDLDTDILADLSPVDVFAKYGGGFMSKLETFWNRIHSLYPHYVTDGGMCLSFEAICANRKSSWVRLGKPFGTTHTELAVSYPSSMLDFLGASFINNSDQSHMYVPHYALESVITDIFTQPMWWKISHAKKVEDLLISLSMIIRQELTEDEFIANFPPDNQTILPVNAYFDYEGFIFYRTLPGGKIDYSKIKTEEYYKAHKFHESNIKYLMSLHDSEIARNRFPLVNVIDSFYTSLDSKLETISNDVLKQMTFDESTDLDTNVLYLALPSKARVSFLTRPKNVQMKMLINATENNAWSNLAFDCFVKVFEIAKSEESMYLIKEIIMNIQPWEPNYLDNINQMIKDKHKSLNNLFGQLYQGV